MIVWSERVVKGQRSQFIAMAEAFRDGRPVYRDGPRCLSGSYLIAAHGWTEEEAIAKRDRDKPYLLAEMERNGHA